MSVFNAVGIYVILDVNSPLGGESIDRYTPSNSYNENYLKRVFSIIDAFMGYSNVLGFFAGNEVINDATSAKVSPPYIRAVQRDMKNYISLHANRTIPVGYSAADDATLRIAGWEYLQCGGDEDSDSDIFISRSDFYGLNSYQWCSGVSTWATSGYPALVSSFADSSIALFFSEFGCNTASPRTFTEINGGVYTEEMLKVFDGGLIYEFSEEDNKFGLVSIDSDGAATLLQDFVNLQGAYANMTYQDFISDAYIDNVTSPSCNSSYIKSIYSGFDSNFTLPDCPATDMLKSGSGNNNIGKWITWNSNQTTYKIYDIDNNEITDTAISVVSDQTVPDYSKSSSSSSSAAPSATATATKTSSIAATTSTEAATTSSSAGAVSAGVNSFAVSVAGLVAAIFAL